MHFIKDVGRIFVFIGGLAIALMIMAYFLGGKSSQNNIEYYLYEYEVAEDYFFGDIE